MQKIENADGQASGEGVRELLPGLLLIGTVATALFVLIAELASLSDQISNGDALLGLLGPSS